MSAFDRVISELVDLTQRLREEYDVACKMAENAVGRVERIEESRFAAEVALTLVRREAIDVAKD